MMAKSPVGAELMLEDPFARHCVGARLRNEAPSTVVDEFLELIGHSRTTVGVSQPAPVVRRYQRDRCQGR